MTRTERIVRNMKRDEDRAFLRFLKQKRPEIYKQYHRADMGYWLLFALGGFLLEFIASLTITPALIVIGSLIYLTAFLIVAERAWKLVEIRRAAILSQAQAQVKQCP